MIVGLSVLSQDQLCQTFLKFGKMVHLDLRRNWLDIDGQWSRTLGPPGVPFLLICCLRNTEGISLNLEWMSSWTWGWTGFWQSKDEVTNPNLTKHFEPCEDILNTKSHRSGQYSTRQHRNRCMDAHIYPIDVEILALKSSKSEENFCERKSDTGQ